MTEAEWLACEAPWPMLTGIAWEDDLRKARLLACAVCRRLSGLMHLATCREALDLSEDFADSIVAAEAMESASAAAGAAYEMEVEKADSAEESVDARLLRAASYAASRRIDVAALVSILHDIAACSPARRAGEHATQANLFRDIFGNPFRPVTFAPEWRTDTVRALAAGMYESRDFVAMPILADALQDAGCDADDILDHCRGPGPHVRGCWVVDLVLGKE